MTPIFVDTNGWIAINYPKDQFHLKAVNLNHQLLDQGNQYVTTNFVLDETYTGLLKKIPHNRITAFGESIRNSKLVRVINVNQIIEDKAWDLFSTYSDKLFSYTDCTSFIVMKEMRMLKSFTNDHHFEQAGFEILLV